LAWVGRRRSAQAHALRARIVLRCAHWLRREGRAEWLDNVRAAEELDVTGQTVGQWRQRFIDPRLAGLLDEPRRGAPCRLSDAVERAFERARERFGRVDIAVASAGQWPRPDESLHQASETRIRAALDANLFGSLWTARAFMASLQRTGPRADGHGASLVFIGSTAGRLGERGHADYATAKAALRGLMLSLKNEVVRLDPFARVNLVEPGWTMTHMARADLETPGVIENVTRTMALRQIGSAADVARTVLVVSSPLTARHISGETLTVAGGMEGRSLWKPGEIDEAAVRARLAGE